RAARAGGGDLPGLARRLPRSPPHRQLRQGVSLRSGPQRRRVGEESPGPLRDHVEMRPIRMIRKIVAAGTGALLLCAVAARPASAADREHLQMMADIRMLQEQAQQLALAIAALNDALKAMTARVDQQLSQQADANRKLFADQKLLIDNVATHLRVIRERSDDTNVRLSALD